MSFIRAYYHEAPVPLPLKLSPLYITNVLTLPLPLPHSFPSQSYSPPPVLQVSFFPPNMAAPVPNGTRHQKVPRTSSHSAPTVRRPFLPPTGYILYLELTFKRPHRRLTRTTATRLMQSFVPTSSLTSSHVQRYHQPRRLPLRHPRLD